MLNKENRKILKTLSGEYHAFALKLKQEVFSRCSDWKAINENLYDMLEMLRSAQEEKRTFSEVIPDPDQTIKETVLCFPAKRYHKILAIGFGAAACIVVASALLVYNAAFAPVQLNSVGTLFTIARKEYSTGLPSKMPRRMRSTRTAKRYRKRIIAIGRPRLTGKKITSYML